MVDARFFTNHGPFTVAHLATVTGASIKNTAYSSRILTDVAPLDRAAEQHVSFFDNVKYVEQFTNSNAGACFVRSKYAEQIPTQMAALITEDPYRCYALAAQQFYPTLIPTSYISDRATIDPTATIGEGATIAAGAVIGANASIGAHTIIGANAVIGQGVVIGEHCNIGPLSSISHSIIGNQVIIHRGVHIGQDGFGFAMGKNGHVKVPQLGRVMIGNDVEIGSGTTIDRGTGPDTIIGDGTKIDNLVQIGHNVQIGKRCILVAFVGISGSTRIGDGAVIGGQTGIAGHLKIGSGVRIAAQSGVINDIPAGASYGGAPAIPVLEWHRQTVAISRLTKPKRGTDE